jgi:hypothetical protein
MSTVASLNSPIAIKRVLIVTSSSCCLSTSHWVWQQTKMPAPNTSGIAWQDAHILVCKGQDDPRWPLHHHSDTDKSRESSINHQPSRFLWRGIAEFPRFAPRLNPIVLSPTTCCVGCAKKSGIPFPCFACLRRYLSLTECST